MAITREQQNGMNVVLKNTPPGLMILDEAALDKAQRAARAARDTAEAKAVDPAQTLRDECEDLARRTADGKALTEQAWKDHDSTEQAKFTTTIKGIEDEISYIKTLMDSPGVTRCLALRQGRENMRDGQVIEGCSCDVHVFRRKITDLEITLRRTKNDAAKSHRICAGNMREAAEIDKLKPRYFELHKMFSKLDTARKVARGITNTDLAPEPVRGMGFTSKHIIWEKNTPQNR
jgi:hypothetical protein